jgi:uncharacterized protein YndB with AHSA1/START domain
MITENRNAAATATERELVLTRVFNAPRERVFKAFTDPKQLAKWWGPRGFTTPVCEVDLRPSGSRRLVMRSSDGVDYPLTGHFLEIVENERIVMTDCVADHNPEWHAMVNQNRPNAKGGLPELLWTLTFEDLEGKTKITIRYHFETAEDRDALVKCGMIEGWTQSLEKLEELLASS